MLTVFYKSLIKKYNIPSRYTTYIMIKYIDLKFEFKINKINEQLVFVFNDRTK